MSAIEVKKQQIPIARTQREVALPENGNAGPAPDFTTMRRNMEHELESRRRNWEQDVARMQCDFFQLSPNSVGPVYREPSAEDPANVQIDVVEREPIAERFPIRQPGSEIIDIANANTLYTVLEDGRRVYRLRFDVRGFEPGEINVRSEERTLSVMAQHEDDLGRGRKNCRQFNRQMDLPDDVDPETIQAHLSTDGILLVEADLDPNKAGPTEQLAIEAIPTLAIGDSTDNSTSDSTSLQTVQANSLMQNRGVGNKESQNMVAQYEKNVHYVADMAKSTPLDAPRHRDTAVRYSTGNNFIHHSPPANTKIIPNPDRVKNTAKSERAIARYAPTPPPSTTILYSPSSTHQTSVEKVYTPQESSMECTNPTLYSPSRFTTKPLSPRHELIAHSTSSPRSAFSRFTSPLVVICNGQRKLKLAVPLGDGYELDDITVRYRNDRLGVFASQEQTEPVRKQREFSREFEIEERIEPSSIIAVLAKDGSVLIGASVEGNVDHEEVIQSIKNDLPVDCVPCRLEL